MNNSSAKHSSRFLLSLLVPAALIALSLPAAAVTLAEIQKLVGSDSVIGDNFSVSFAIDGDTIAVGATNAGEPPSGAVYVFERNTDGSDCALSGGPDAWCEQAKVTSDNNDPFEYFGEAVAIQGDTLFVGARRDDANGDDPVVPFRAGSVYVFTLSDGTWMQQYKLVASDATDNVQARFGSGLAVDGDVLVVSAGRDSAAAYRAGAVYIFRLDAGVWSEEVKLTAPDAEDFDNFTAASISGNTIVIGASGDDDAALGAGAVYVYDYDGTNWILNTKLMADDAAPDDIFGTEVHISGNLMIVGAPHFFESGVYSGAAYVFGRTAGVWTQQGKLVPSDGFDGDAYGFGVAISEMMAVVTADRDNDAGTDSGSMYVYSQTPTGWVEVDKILASDAGELGWFGTRVRISGDTVVSSAWPIFPPVTHEGAAYVFQIDTDDDGERDSQDNCPIIPNADQSDQNSNGVGDLCEIGTMQTFSDGGTPVLGRAWPCGVPCLANGWTFNAGGVVPDAGKDGTGDNALLYDANDSGFHLLTHASYTTADRAFLGNLYDAYVVGVRFDARHSGVGEGPSPVVLHAFLRIRSGDFALSNEYAEIISVDNDTWKTYTISLKPADMVSFEGGGAGTLPPKVVLGAVRLFGLRHDPDLDGPGFQDRIDAEVYFDNIQLIIDADIDGDGIANDIDTAPRVASFDFDDGTTSGTITVAGDQILSIIDEPDPAGVRIIASESGGAAAATVSVCDGTANLTFSAGDESVVTCTSVQVLVIEGEVEMEVEVNGETAIVSVPANNMLTFVPETETEPATFSAPVTNPNTVLVIVGGAEVPVVPGQTIENIVLVEIDIKPGSDPNCFNINGHGVIPVAILGGESFGVSDIDQNSLSFGGLEVRMRGKKGPLCGLEDINGDGFSDLVCHFEDDTSHWIGGSSTATLIGERLDGTSFAGTDSICVVP